MGTPVQKPIKRVASRCVIAVTASALIAAVPGQLSLPAHPQMSYDIVNTAAIEDQASTVGIAESYLYYEVANATTTAARQAIINQAFDALQSLGVSDVRIAIPWNTVETADGKFNWTVPDMIVAEAEKRGMGILASISHAPAWAGGGVGSAHPSTDQAAALATFASQFADFTSAVATRYSTGPFAGAISSYEIWNEPNGALEWNPSDPAAYTALLKAAYTAIKAVNTNISVIGGVVGAGWGIPGLSVDPVGFVAGMYAAGAKGFFDALSFHPYSQSLPFSSGVGATLPGGLSAVQQVKAIRDLMAVNNDESLKIWISEYGYATANSSDAEQLKQAQFIADLVNYWQTFQGGGPIFLYTAHDTMANSSVAEYNFGLFTYNWVAKYAANIVKQLVANPSAIIDFPTTLPGPVGAALGALAQQVAAAVNSIVNAVAGVVMSPVKAAVTVANSIANALAALKKALTKPKAATAVAKSTASAAALSAAVATESVDATTAEAVTTAGASVTIKAEVVKAATGEVAAEVPTTGKAQAATEPQTETPAQTVTESETVTASDPVTQPETATVAETTKTESGSAAGTEGQSATEQAAADDKPAAASNAGTDRPRKTWRHGKIRGAKDGTAVSDSASGDATASGPRGHKPKHRATAGVGASEGSSPSASSSPKASDNGSGGTAD